MKDCDVDTIVDFKPMLLVDLKLYYDRSISLDPIQLFYYVIIMDLGL